MLLHFNEDRRVLWFNTCISKERAQECLSPNTVWVDSDFPEAPQKDGCIPYFIYTNEGELAYDYEPEPEPFYSDIQTVMQAITDLELLLLGGGI